MKLEWNVYYRDDKEIRVLNIFQHSDYRRNVVKLLEDKSFSKKEFESRLRTETMYYFWSKYEYEIVLTSFPPYIDKDEYDRITQQEVDVYKGVNLVVGEKVDIYQQISLNWNRFVDYVWGSKEES